MITNVRIGNDIKLMWQILKGGQPVDLTGATDVKVSVFQGGNSSCGNVYIGTFKITDAVNGILSVEIPKEVITEVGYMWTVLEYTLHDDDMIDGDRKVTVDNVPVRIVSLTAEASQVYEFNVSSDILAGFQGLSAYEVWLKDNPGKTEEDYFNWLQKPATDAVSLIDDKIEHLDEVIDSSTENESERVTAENTRKTAEATRISAETERKANEVERLANEASRASEELIREANESSRKQDEATRKTNENEREIAETTRVSNENNRVTAEQERVQAESLRATAESSRELAESLRVDAEILRQTNTQIAITNAEEATLNANTAAQNADDAREAIQDDLALKANHGYDSSPKTLKEVDDNLVQLESDVEQLAYVKIKNEAVNGNFENGLIAPFRRNDGVGGESTLAINSSNPISGNYDIRLTIITPSTGVARPGFWGLDGAANIGDKIYLHFYAKILSGVPIIGQIHNGRTNSSIYGGDVINGRNTRIIDVTGTERYLGAIYFNSLSVWDMQMDNFVRINLTETFGDGNEPTEEEMNLLISTLGIDYFEGEITIPAQKIMQWQLKLIRKNKNAIIALGGTII